MEVLHQGDILKIEKIKHPVLIVSKDFFNTSGEIIGCPIINKGVSLESGNMRAPGNQSLNISGPHAHL